MVTWGGMGTPYSVATFSRTTLALVDGGTPTRSRAINADEFGQVESP